ncbi:MAG: glycosyltransferase family 4 protein [Pseudolabrys sp.]
MAKKILYLVAEDWYFVSHRLPMARAARSAGYEVHVATRVVEYAHQIENEGFALHPIAWHRGSINPLQMMAAAIAIRRLYRKLQPDIVHHVAFAPAIIGSLAAIGLPMAKLNALAGLGFVFTSKTAKAQLLRLLAHRLLGFVLKRPGTMVLVQNPDDGAMVERLGVAKDRIALIPGSGVDIELLTPLTEPDGPFTVAFVGRLLYDKGVEALVRAHEILNKQGLRVRALLAGVPDPSNPASIPEPTLAHWRQRENLVLIGHVEDVRTVWAKAHVAVLPSRREGLPKSLLEAAACGRPLIASDVPGCREIARHGVNALLVPPDDPEALAHAIATLMNDPDIRIRFGRASRQIVVADFSSARIGDEIVALYARLLAQAVPSDDRVTSWLVR